MSPVVRNVPVDVPVHLSLEKNVKGRPDIHWGLLWARTTGPNATDVFRRTQHRAYETKPFDRKDLEGHVVADELTDSPNSTRYDTSSRPLDLTHGLPAPTKHYFPNVSLGRQAVVSLGQDHLPEHPGINITDPDVITAKGTNCSPHWRSDPMNPRLPDRAPKPAILMYRVVTN